MMSILFGTEIASISGVVAEKNVRRQVQTDRFTAFQLHIYMISNSTQSTPPILSTTHCESNGACLCTHT